MSTASPAQERDATLPGAAAPDRAPRWVLPVLVALCAVTVLVRTVIGLAGGLWRDEAQVLFVVGEPSWASMLEFLRLHESHPPLYYVLLRAWLSVAGHGDVAALALPIALGAALPPALYAAGRRLFDWRTGLLAAALGVVSPPLAAFGGMARPYSLLPLLTLATTYALVRAVQLGGTMRWAGHAAGALALVYTHNWAWLVVGAQWVALAAVLWRGVGRPRAGVLRGFAAAQAAVAIGYLPWLPSFLYQSAHAGYSPHDVLKGVDGPGDVLVAVLAIVITLLSATLLPWGVSPVAAAAVFWALCVTVLAAVLTRRSAPAAPAGERTAATVLAVAPLAAMAAAVVLSARSDLLVPHCLAMLGPLLVLLVARVLVRWGGARHRVLAAATAAALLVGYAAMLPGLFAPRSDARELAATAGREVAPADLVVVTPWWLASPFNRYYTGPGEQLDFPALTRVGAVPYDDEISRLRDPGALAEAERRIAAAHAADRRLWFVTSTYAPSCADDACRARIDRSRTYPEVGDLRAAQLREYVLQLYGRPVRCETPAEVGARLESLTACLFEAS